MGRYRTINVDLNRQYRNDLNQNFTDIEKDIFGAESDIARVEAESKERDNLMAGTDVDAIIQRIDTSADNADVQAQYAKTQGDYAKTQGEYAKSQGDYASSKGEYANEKAILADGAAANANSEASNLSQLKIDVTTATQNANTATSNADTARTNANNAATYANTQGDYAKREADRVASMDVASLEQQISSHLDETNAHAEIGDRTIYVGSSRSLENLQQALASIKKDLGGKTITILLDNGDYTGYGEIFSNGFSNGVLSIASLSYASTAVTLSNITVLDCNCKLQISDVTINTPSTCVGVYRTNELTLLNSRLIGDNKSAYGVYSESSNVKVNSCEISGKGTAIIADVNSKIHVLNNTGTNNDVALHAIGASITTHGTLPTATTIKTESQGGWVRP